MTSRRLIVEIEELVLEGLPRVNYQIFITGLENELNRQNRNDGFPPAVWAEKNMERFDFKIIENDASKVLETAGSSLAKNIHGWLRH